MARTRTLLQLRTMVRERADIENSLHITDTEINTRINQSVAAFYGMIAEQDDGALILEATVSAAAGATTADIVSGLTEPYKILAVDVINDTTGQSYPMQRFSMQERALLDSASANGGSSGQRSLYQWRNGNTLTFSPPLESATTLRVTYIGVPAEMTADADKLDGRLGWEDWIVADVAVWCMIKEESNPADLVRERALIWDRIVKQMANRDRGEPRRMRDVNPSIIEEW